MDTFWGTFYKQDSPNAVEASSEVVDVPRETLEQTAVEQPEMLQEQPKTDEPSPFTLGDDFAPPEKFEEGTDELGWYKEKYNALHKGLTDPAFYDRVMEQYGEKILAKEAEAEKIKETWAAIQKNPRDYIRQHFPESLAELGISPVMSAEELTSSVDAKLKAEFGENYRDLYNVEDLAPWKGETLTRQIYNRGQELHNELSQQNSKNKEIFEGYTKKVAEGASPVSEEQTRKYIEDNYKDFEKAGIDRSTYDSFVQELEKAPMPGLMEFYKLKNYEQTMENARKMGYEEGRKAALQNIERAAQPNFRQDPAPVQQKSDRVYDDHYMKMMKSGYLPLI